MVDANRGDASAFEALYLRYRDWVVRLALRFTTDREEALDVMQDTFAYLLKKFPGFRLTARMTTFLYPVVRNIALTHGRRRREQSLDDDFTTNAAAIDRTDRGQTSAPTSSLERIDWLAAIVGQLSEPQREVLLMRFVDDLPLAEIAAALDIPEGTVKSRLHHALDALRRDPRTRDYFDT